MKKYKEKSESMKKIMVDEIYLRAKDSFGFGARGECIYVDAGRYWKKISEREAVQYIYGFYPEAVQACLSDASVKEALARLRNTPSLQIVFTEELEEKYVNVNNGIFDVEQGKLLTERQGEELGLKFSYLANFNYRSTGKNYYDISLKQAPVFQRFVQEIFRTECENKTRLLLEIIGYCLSDYTEAKAGFFLIGASNSGKSTLLTLVKRVLSEGSVTAIPLYRLANRFNLARLDGVRVNVCSELSEESFRAEDVFKQITSGEVVTAEHKGRAPFEFKIRCKSLNAGNMLPIIRNVEGMEAVLNRLVILLFPMSVARDKQELDLGQGLWKEKDVIFSMALDALARLRKNNFVFVEPQDTAKLRAQMLSQGRVFEEFIQYNCVREKEAKAHTASLYDAFLCYCEENLCDVKLSKGQFSQRLCRMQGIERKKLRIQGSKPLWGVEGIRLKKVSEYDKNQDSEASDSGKKKDSPWEMQE